MKKNNFAFLLIMAILFGSCATEQIDSIDQESVTTQVMGTVKGNASTARLALGTYYVSTTGSDVNNSLGSMSSPWKSITFASSQVGPGSTIIVLPGIYADKQLISKSCSGTAGNPTIIKAENTATSISDPASSLFSLFDPGEGTTPVYGDAVIKIEAGSQFITVEGLKVQNSNFFGIDVDGEETSTSDDIIVKNCRVFNTQGSGIYSKWGNRNKILSNKVEKACQWAGRDSQGRAAQECITVTKNFNFQINNNEVSNSTVNGEGGEGIDAKGGSSDGEISNNYVHDLYEIGLYIDAGLSTNIASNIRVHKNKIYNTAGVRIAGEAGGTVRDFYFYNNIIKNSRTSGFWLQDVSPNRTEAYINIYIANNTFYNNGQQASTGSGSGDILCFLKTVNNGIVNNSSNWIIKNNIFYNTTTTSNFSIRIDTPHPGLDISNNLFYNFKPSVVGKYKQADLNADSTSKVGDPLFINGLSNNFDLSSTLSPAYNSGIPIILPNGTLLFTVDMDGVARGSNWDIGAYEY